MTLYTDTKQLKILIVAEHASARFGGEAALPLHYFRVLSSRGIDTWLITHERTRAELEANFPSQKERITYIPDSIWHRLLWKLGRALPNRISSFSTGTLMRLLTQAKQRKVAKRIIVENKIQVVHQPMPVSPKDPSILFGFGVPVVIGPMNGGISYPPAFNYMEGQATRAFVCVGRKLSGLINFFLPGKRYASALLVANHRTRAALPSGCCPNVIDFVENGVDLSTWQSATFTPPRHYPPRFVFIGRLVDWKAVDILVDAFSLVIKSTPAALTIIGDGDQRSALERICKDREIFACSEGESGKIYFSGWLTQSECASILANSDVLVLPSLQECGGAVVLEAMAMQRPVIATAWGGPMDYLDSTCGILIDPTSRGALVDGFATAMVRLAQSPDERVRMGLAGYRKVQEEYDWNIKVDNILKTYVKAIEDKA